MAEQRGHARLSLRSSLTARAFYEPHGSRAIGEASSGEERRVVMTLDLGRPFAPARRM